MRVIVHQDQESRVNERTLTLLYTLLHTYICLPILSNVKQAYPFLTTI